MFYYLFCLQRGLEVKLLSTHKLFIRTNVNGLTVLPKSGDVVVLGAEGQQDDALWALHIFRQCQGHLEHRSVEKPCQHLHSNDILGLVIEGHEFIAAACGVCRDIKLVEPMTGLTYVAYHNPHHQPCCLCEAKPGRLWVAFYSDPFQTQAMELNCEKRTFIEPHENIIVKMNNCPLSLCYLLGSKAALVCCDKHKVWAISCDDGSTLWEVEEPVAGEIFSPYKVLPDLQGVLVIDYDEFVVLSASGSVLQCIELPEEIGEPPGLCWSNHQLVLANNWADSTISFYKVWLSIINISHTCQ